MSKDLHQGLRDPNPFGIRSVVIRNMKLNAKNQYYKDRKKFEKDIDIAIKLLQNAKFDALDVFDESNKCSHPEFKNLQTSVRHSLFEYYNHYERTCTKCGYTESHSVYENDTFKPDWVKKGLEVGTFVNVYYNNDF